jgi:nanoRNase/pAp phosphatase (c-di-AMP/oligoRNAs hydrolase)
MKKIITSGYPYTDIDVLACALSYEQLLKLEGYEAHAVLTGPMNLSINRSLKQTVKYESELKFGVDMCEFIIVDLSLPEFYSKFVKEDKVIEIFDHRFFNPNLNKLKQELKDKCHIEQVGSCSTLIYEEFKKRGYVKNLSELNALLIYSYSI